MAKQKDDLGMPQQGGERGDYTSGRPGEDIRSEGVEDIRGIAGDEDDDEFEDADELDEPEDDDSEDL